jgi:hypothetical protein
MTDYIYTEKQGEEIQINIGEENKRELTDSPEKNEGGDGVKEKQNKW